MRSAQLLLYLFGILVIVLFNEAKAEPQKGRYKRIIGGYSAEETQFPYQVVLVTRGITFCGGSILSERFIITAAHCVVNRNGVFKKYPIKVIAGTTDLNSESDNRKIVDVDEVYVPKEYDPTTNIKFETGDIAILKLNKDLNFDGTLNLGKVELPRRDETYDRVKAMIAGFGWSEIKIVRDRRTGLSEEKGKHSDTMRFAQADVVDFQDCQKSYVLYKINKKHICARVVQHNPAEPEGVCSGDSGGPLVYNRIQIGVLSSNAYKCSEKARPAIYTRVSEYLDFIRKVINGTIDDSICKTTLKIVS